jgi:hypothetical protein
MTADLYLMDRDGAYTALLDPYIRTTSDECLSEAG